MRDDVKTLLKKVNNTGVIERSILLRIPSHFKSIDWATDFKSSFDCSIKLDKSHYLKNYSGASDILYFRKSNN
jgi:hypothetical protein